MLYLLFSFTIVPCTQSCCKPYIPTPSPSASSYPSTPSSTPYSYAASYSSTTSTTPSYSTTSYSSGADMGSHRPEQSRVMNQTPVSSQNYSLERIRSSSTTSVPAQSPRSQQQHYSNPYHQQNVQQQQIPSHHHQQYQTQPRQQSQSHPHHSQQPTQSPQKSYPKSPSSSDKTCDSTVKGKYP